MASDNDLINISNVLLTLPLVTTLTLGMSLFIYAIFNDYVLYYLVDVAEKLESQGVISGSFLLPLDKMNEILLAIPQFVDYLFLISFVGMVFAMFYYSYKANRQGYFETFTYISYGTIVFLFVLSIIKVISDYLYNVF